MKRPKFYKVSVQFLVALEDPEKQDARDATKDVLLKLNDGQAMSPVGESPISKRGLLIDGYHTTAIRKAEQEYFVEQFPVVKV